MSQTKEEKKENNQALYRKYRPSNFGEVIGQDHIVGVIEKSLKEGKVAHAYLLCGPRGTGKTTVARIIAAELGSSVNDIYELDAASNRGIDDVRNIKENVHTLPFDSKYKVYILDEVHMFTKDAWNALLKTIEEPPAHVIFILATTEIEKVPETIISRCQSFIFKKPNEELLTKVISQTAKKEGYSLEKGGAELIALLSDGAFRDAHGILQKVISYSKDKEITLKEIQDINSAPASVLVEDFLVSITKEDLELGLKTISLVVQQNIDIQVYTKMVISSLRYALILRHAPNMKTILLSKVSDREINFIEELIKDKPKNISSGVLEILLDTFNNIKHSYIQQLPIELALIKIIDGK